MRTARSGQETMRRTAFSLSDLLWLLFILLLLLAILLPSLSRARELSKRAVCAANLRGIGQGCKIYANDHNGWYPHHTYYEGPADLTKRPPEHGVTWVGTMGSNDFLRITERTTATKSPRRNHPSRSLFMLIIDGTCTTTMFVCPSSADVADDRRNYERGVATAYQPGVNRFDFLGYDRLSYGYQLPYGPRAKPHENLDPRMVVMADKGPYYAAGGEGLPGTRTVRDRRSTSQPPLAWTSSSPADILGKPNDAWRPFNSRNHRSEGQNVLFSDGHVSFEKRPIVGVHYDNVYTLQSDFDLRGILIGLVPDEDQPLGPLTNTDSFIVP